MPLPRPCPPVKSYLSKVGVWLAPQPPLTLLSGDQNLWELCFPNSPAAGGLHVSQGSPASHAMLGEGTQLLLSQWSPQAQKPSRWSFQVSEQLLVQTLMPGLQLRAEILQLPGESSNSCEAGSCRDLEVFRASV